MQRAANVDVRHLQVAESEVYIRGAYGRLSLFVNELAQAGTMSMGVNVIEESIGHATAKKVQHFDLCL